MEEFKNGDKVTIVKSDWNDSDTLDLIGQSGTVVCNYGDSVYKVIIDDRAVRCWFDELKLT